MQIMTSSGDVGEQAHVNEAMETMQDISTYVNECKRDQEAVAVIQRVQRSVNVSLQPSYSFDPSSQDGSGQGTLKGSDRRSRELLTFTNYGRLVHDGPVKLVDPEEGSSKQKQRYIFLFERMLLVCKMRNGTFDFKRAHDMSEYELWHNELEDSGNGGGSGGGSSNTLPLSNSPSSGGTLRLNTTLSRELSRKLTATLFDNTTLTLARRSNRGSGNESSLQITAKTVALRNEWRESLKKVIEINHPSQARAKGHSLLYKTYTMATSCLVCGKLLAGKFYQGYHCSGCNLDMHGCCSGMRNCTGVARTPSQAAAVKKPVPAVRTRRQSATNGSPSPGTHCENEFPI